MTRRRKLARPKLPQGRPRLHPRPPGIVSLPTARNNIYAMPEWRLNLPDLKEYRAEVRRELKLLAPGLQEHYRQRALAGTLPDTAREHDGSYLAYCVIRRRLEPALLWLAQVLIPPEMAAKFLALCLLEYEAMECEQETSQ